MTTPEDRIPRLAAYRAVVRDWPERGLLACSGGVDSSALLVLAGTAARRGDIPDFIVAHIDHRTRPESGREADAVVLLAERFGLSAVRATIDSADDLTATASPEEHLRTQRYAALARVAGERGLDAVVTAHTQDDQVETVLMRLLSGAGGLASAGMAARQALTTPQGPINIVRPLLAVSRAELLDVLEQAGVTPFLDPTNVDRAFRRNAIRHDLVPAIRNAYPGFESALLRSVTLAARDASALDDIARELIPSEVTCLGDTIRVNRRVVRSAHPSLSTRLIRWAASRLMPDNQRELTFERIERVREAAGGRTGAVIELPYGIVARINRDEIVFERRNQ